MAALLDAVAEYITSHCLVGALGASVSASVIERLAELELRTSEIETRLGEIQQAIAAIDRTVIDPDDEAKALAQFDPVWDALVPREQANLLQLLIERVGYDGQARWWQSHSGPTGIAWLGGGQRSAA